MGVKIINLPSYRPELKGKVEKLFDVIQSTYKKYLKGKGIIEPDYQERGAHDYRRDACLTMADFEKIILHCIVYYNAQRIVKFPFTEEITEWLYEHSAGVTSVGVALLHDAQEIAILDGSEVLNLETLNEAYQKRLSLLHGYIEPSIVAKKQISQTKKKSSGLPQVAAQFASGHFSVAELVNRAKKEETDIVRLLKEHFSVVEIAV